jgi:lipoyl(octanoyl) transferase
MKQPSRPIQVVDWGYLPFREAHARQLAALEERIAGEIGDTVFLVEHPHVYTYGRGAGASIPEGPVEVLGQSVDRVVIERGGDVTYHGPGQLVAYPIVDVKSLTGDLHLFLHWLEDVVIQTLAPWGIRGSHHREYTGVWVGDRKIASIGIAVRKWVSYHGLALNVSSDLGFFGAIVPCGLPPQVMISMESVTGYKISLTDVNARFRSVLLEGFSPE